MRAIAITEDDKVPCLGQGTWNMGENRNARADEIAALGVGIDLGD